MSSTIETTEHMIERIVQTIAAAFHPRRIILFGSHARGQAGPDSDIDLFVEMETGQRLPERAIAISAAFGLHLWPMDIIVYTPREVARLRQANDILLAAIEREGKVLYERA
jgi:predicted nucleotidyltransferase